MCWPPSYGLSMPSELRPKLITPVIPSDRQPSGSGPLRAMVVDDSLVIRSLISRMLDTEPATVKVVASVANGQLAVERARKRDIDVVVLDIEMPVMDGISALSL